MKIMIGDECSLLHVAQLAERASHNKHVAASSESSSGALLCTDLVGSLSDDSMLQIMSTAAGNLPTPATLKDPSALGALNLPILLTDKKSVDGCSEENVSDLDLSFLNEAGGGLSIVSDANENVVKELQGMMAASQPLNLNFLGSLVECSQQPAEMESNDGGEDTVMIDVSQPIQLSQNSLIVVNGQKCVLQQDPRTGQVVAYPVKDSGRPPPKKRGRPRKRSVEQQVCISSERNPPQETETLSEEEREKGLLEVLNDDGSLVRRSSRKRKKAKALKDYETGNLQQELGSDVDDLQETDVEHFNRRRRPKGPGRPRKFTNSFEIGCENTAIKESDARRPRGRPRKEGGESQAFLVQTADGQTLVLQVPLSSIPQGTTLQEMAQEIANKLNLGQGFVKCSIPSLCSLLQSSDSSAGVEKCSSRVEEEPALQDHSIGSTTTTHLLQPPLVGGEEEICEEITLECDQSLDDVTSGTNLPEESNLTAPESLEDNFCLDVSSTTNNNNTSVDAPLLCPFNEHLIDHNFYVMKTPKTVPEEDVSHEDILVEEKAESTIVTVDPVLQSSDSKDLYSSQNVTLIMGDTNSTLTQELPIVSPSKVSEAGVLTVLLQESSLSLPTVAGVTVSSVPEKLSPVLIPAEISPGPKKCKICAVPYFTEEEIVEHFKAKHPKCICLECNYMNEHPYGIKRHSYRHASEECVCTICNKKYKDLYILKMHMKMVHLPPEVLFRCDVCGKEFTRKAHLKRHQRIHAPLRQYRCHLCDYHGCEKSDVTKHLLIHEEPKFKCEVCGKAFRHLKNKELHIKRHSGQRDYKCAACNFYGYTYTDIRKHIERRHSALCHLCKQLFADPELCKEHKRLGLCQSSLLEAPPPPTPDDKKEIVLFGEMASLDL